MLDVKTMNVSCVIAKIAGIESTAKTTSVPSTTSRARNSGVTARRPPMRVKKRSPSLLLATRRKRRASRTTGLADGS